MKSYERRALLAFLSAVVLTLAPRPASAPVPCFSARRAATDRRGRGRRRVQDLPRRASRGLGGRAGRRARRDTRRPHDDPIARDPRRVPARHGHPEHRRRSVRLLGVGRADVRRAAARPRVLRTPHDRSRELSGVCLARPAQRRVRRGSRELPVRVRAAPRHGVLPRLLRGAGLVRGAGRAVHARRVRRGRQRGNHRLLAVRRLHPVPRGGRLAERRLSRLAVRSSLGAHLARRARLGERRLLRDMGRRHHAGDVESGRVHDRSERDAGPRGGTHPRPAGPVQHVERIPGRRLLGHHGLGRAHRHEHAVGVGLRSRSRRLRAPGPRSSWGGSIRSRSPTMRRGSKSGAPLFGAGGTGSSGSPCRAPSAS